MRRFMLLLAAIPLLTMALTVPASAVDDVGTGPDLKYVATDSFGATTTKDDDQAFYMPAGYVDTSPIFADFTASSAAQSKTSSIITDTACVNSGVPAKDCKITYNAGIDAQNSATAADLAAMKAAGIDTDVFSKTAIHCFAWHQATRAALWEEKHIGKACYNHVDVRIWRWDGYHHCGLGGYQIGWDVRVTNCVIHRVEDRKAQGGYFRQNYDYYKTCYLYAPFICNGRKMHVNVFPSGRVTFHNAT